MALRDQPYLPLYIQDFLTDEKLSECSPTATGVYIRLMCIMHKSEHYGKILLKQKDKQNESMTLNFASKISKQMPWPEKIVHESLIELLEEKVLQIDGDFLIQKRMVKDCELSEKRAVAGKKGITKKIENDTNFANGFAQAKQPANTEYENEIVNEYGIENVVEDEKKGTPRAKPEPTSLHTACKEAYLKEYPEHYWTAKDGAALNQLIQRIRKSVKVNGRQDTDEEVLKAFEIIIPRPNAWMKDHGKVTIPDFNSQYTSVIAEIKNSKNGISRQEVEQAIRTTFG